jgi:hypothetical protein
MKHQLGISVYPDLRPLEEIEAYIAMASKYGVTRLFSSMFNIQGSKEEVLDYFRELIQICHRYNIQVSLDVNTECFERLGVTPDDISVFDEIKCDIIRMDGSYGDERDIALINNPYGILVEFNTSMVEEHIAELIAAGADPKRMISCHNFYPQPYTGMEWEKFKRINHHIKDLADIRIAAFVSSNNHPTHGVWDAEYGLPTVEKMRTYPIDLQARILLATGDVDDILVGNAYASEQELAALQEVLNKEWPPLPQAMREWIKDIDQREPKVVKIKLEPDVLDCEKAALHFYPHIDLGDSSEWIWRSRAPRAVFTKESFIARDAKKDVFDLGDVVVVNDNYKHYAGEVQIVRLPMKNDGLRNLVGKIEYPQSDMIELLNDGDIVVFEEA